MPTIDRWEDLSSYLRDRHGPRITIEPAKITLVAEPAPALTLKPIDVGDAGWVELICSVGEMRALGPRMALGTSWPIGAVCAPDGRVLLRQLLPLPGLASEDLDDAVTAFAHLGAELEAALAATSSGDDP